MTRFPIRAALALVALSLAGCGTARPPVEGPATGVRALPGHDYLVSAEARVDARRHLFTLAADDMGGREAGSPGERAAADYLARELGALGLEPAGDSLGPGRRSFFQDVPLQTVRFTDGARLALDGGPPFALGDDWIAFPQSTPGRDLSAPLVFAGYGLSVPDRGHDDYAGLDVAGKVVLVAPGHPAGIDSVATPQGTAPAGAFLPQYITALQRGATAVVVVADPTGSMVGGW